MAVNQKSAEWSRRVWATVVWPALAHYFPDHKYTPIEDLPHDLARSLDCDGGTDAFLIRRGSPPIGLATRAQALEIREPLYNTYTLRVVKPSGLPTEIHKRWTARCDPVVYHAALTGQAYLRDVTDELLTAAISLSAEIIDAVPRKSRPVLVNPADGVLFTYVAWKEVPLRAEYGSQPRLFDV
jgi:hypothetical protein